MRIVIDPKRNEDPNVILNNLFSLTPLSTTFGIILLAIDKNKPQLLGDESRRTRAAVDSQL